MASNDTRLIAALRRLTAKPAPAPVQRPPRGSRDWQQLIETELDTLNRRLSAIETRMTLIFYLVVILTVVTVIRDAGAAEQLIKAVLQLP